MSQIYDILNRMITAMYKKIQEAAYARSVNGVAPDGQGNILLSASAVGAVAAECPYATQASMDDIKKAGSYWINPSVTLDAPYGLGGVLDVAGSPALQRYNLLGNRPAIIRFYNQGTWTSWRQISGEEGAWKVCKVCAQGPDSKGNVALTASDVGALPKSGGAMTGVLTAKGLVLTKGVDFGDSLPGTVTPGKLFFLRSGSGGSSEMAQYTGNYQVTPTSSGQTLETGQKFLADDITVQAIPFSSVENSAGGTTVTIGNENNLS